MNIGSLLIIGYGNTLRSDDGVGPRIAEAVAKWRLPDVRSMGCHQLTPELVVPIAAAGEVVFVDAAKDYRFVRLQEVEAVQSVQTMTHTVDPSSLLQLTKVLYGRCPKGLSLMIPAEDFRFGEKLSDVCCGGMEIALAHIRALALHRCPKNVSSKAKTEKRLATEAWRFPVMNGIVLKRT